MLTSYLHRPSSVANLARCFQGAQSFWAHTGVSDGSARPCLWLDVSACFRCNVDTLFFMPHDAAKICVNGVWLGADPPACVDAPATVRWTIGEFVPMLSCDWVGANQHVAHSCSWRQSC